MNEFTNKFDVIGDGSGGNTRHTSTRSVMNPVIGILAKLGILNDDFDYHLIRAAMVIIFFFFGYQKWFAYEVERLIPISVMARSSFGSIRLLVCAAPLGFWAPRNGPSAHSCSWDFGTGSWASSGRSAQAPPS